MILDDCISYNVAMQFPNHHICVVVSRMRVNRGAEFGQEIPFDFIFYGDSRITTSIKKSLEKEDNSLNVKGEKVVKYKHLKIK